MSVNEDRERWQGFKCVCCVPVPPPVVSSTVLTWLETPPPSVGPPLSWPGFAHRRPWPPQPE